MCIKKPSSGRQTGWKHRDIAKNTKEAQQAVQDEIDSRVKDSSDAVCAGFDKAIAGDREKLKEVQNKRDKAKLAGVKERIAAETAHIHKENEALKNQVKDAFAQETYRCFVTAAFILHFTEQAHDRCIDLPVVYRH